MKNAELWKSIVKDGLSVSDPEWAGAVATDLRNRISSAQIIVDTRYRDEVAERGQAFNWSTYDRVGVPFPSTWIEGSYFNPAGGIRWGALFVSQGEHRYVVWTFLKYPNTPLAVVPGNVLVQAKGAGSIFPDGEERRGFHLAEDLVARAGRNSTVQSVETVLDNAMDTLLMLTCSNVALDPRDVVGRSKNAIKRHGGDSLSFRYHVLVMRRPGAKPSEPGEEIGVMPRHVCRGHFAEYGPEFGKGLLFGKHAGRFYVPPHLRGDKKNGIVEKDYQVGRGEAASGG